MAELNRQVAIVTGASRGIGAAVAFQLASLGASVVLTARDSSRLASVGDSIEQSGGIAHAFPCDLLDAENVARLSQIVQDRHGRCDILVNSAGVGSMGRPLHAMNIEDWDMLMATNLRAPFLMIRAFAPLMIATGGGHIINISSLAGKNPLPNGAAYSASKWGLNGLTYSVAEELRPHNIRVSVVAPGSVNTEFGGNSSSGKDPSKKLQPGDVARVVAMLVTQAPQSFVSEVLMRPAQKP